MTRLRGFSRDLRVETKGRFAAAVERARHARDLRHPSLDASTAAAAALAFGDVATDEVPAEEVRNVIRILAFAEASERGRVRA